jgi:hypothetical protein
MIVNNTAPNYRECLRITQPTWKGKLALYAFDGNTFNEHCTNKIKAIQSAIKQYPNENIVYLDTDVIQTRELPEIWTHDIIATRMVIRPERPYYKEVNAGVFFMKSNERTARFVEEWFELDKQYQQDPTIPYPEQRAFNDLCYKYYDSGEISVSNISENLFNFERDDTKEWMKGIEKYNPYLIHMKQSRWKSEFSLEYLRSRGIIK